jgi:hypothetical protein
MEVESPADMPIPTFHFVTVHAYFTKSPLIFCISIFYRSYYTY